MSEPETSNVDLYLYRYDIGPESPHEPADMAAFIKKACPTARSLRHDHYGPCIFFEATLYALVGEEAKFITRVRSLPRRAFYLREAGPNFRYFIDESGSVTVSIKPAKSYTSRLSAIDGINALSKLGIPIEIVEVWL